MKNKYDFFVCDKKEIDLYESGIINPIATLKIKDILKAAGWEKKK